MSVADARQYQFGNERIIPPALFDCYYQSNPLQSRQELVAPLRFTRHAITIPVHFGIGTILNEIFGLVTGSHVRAMSAPVAIEPRRRELARI
jgi:hypothetical protein